MQEFNFVVQGSAYDMLANAIVEIDRAGLGDKIVLSMHDELVLDCDEEAAREIEHIMLTPPQFLVNWLGRAPKLRCDRKELGRAWAKT